MNAGPPQVVRTPDRRAATPRAKLFWQGPLTTQCGLALLFCVLFWIGYSVWWVLLFALIPLALLLCRPSSLPRRMLIGFVAGFLALGSRQYFFGLLSLPGLIALSALEGVTVMLVAVAAGWVYGRTRWPMAFILPVAWVGAEYWRTLGPCGLPNASLAWPCWQQLWLIQVCDLGGTYVISFAIAMLGGCAADFLLAARNGARGILRRPVVFGGMATVSLWIFIAGYGAFRLNEAEATMHAGPVLTVVQPDIPTSSNVEILEGFDPLMFREQMLAWSAQGLSAQPPPAMVVWPEAMTTMPPLNPELLTATINSTERLHGLRETGREWKSVLRAWVDKTGVPLVTGGPVWMPARGEAESARRYNAATLIEPGTARLQRQAKMRLFPVGEFIPWEGTMLHDWLDRWINRKTRVTASPPISPGERREIFELGMRNSDRGISPRLRYAICLCSEILFSETSTVFLKGDGARKPVDFLINISNDGFLQRSEGQVAHFHVLPFRAVEARVGIARSSNTGVSGFVKPTGEIYGEVVNARGQNWTGLGAPELPLIAEVVKFRAAHEPELAGNPALAGRLREMIARIEALRQQAGVTGQSTRPVYVDSRRTLYSRSDDWFAKSMFGLLLLGLAGATILPGIGALSRAFR